MTRCLGNPDIHEDDLREVVAAMEASGALEAARDVARQYADRAGDGDESSVSEMHAQLVDVGPAPDER